MFSKPLAILAVASLVSGDAAADLAATLSKVNANDVTDA